MSRRPAEAAARESALRAKILFYGLFLIAGFMAVRFFLIQVRDGPALAEHAYEQRLATVEFAAHRGSIYDRDEKDWAESVGIRIVHIEEYFELGPDRVIAEARRIVGDGPTYVSFDVDGLDPVYAPGTGTPEVGGYSTAEAQKMLRSLAGLDLVGGDVVEVAPPFDPSGNTALVGATMMFEILCVLAPAVHRRKTMAVAAEPVAADGD